MGYIMFAYAQNFDTLGNFKKASHVTLQIEKDEIRIFIFTAG